MKKVSELLESTQFPIAALKSCHGSLCYTTQDLQNLLPKPYLNMLDISYGIGIPSNVPLSKLFPSSIKNDYVLSTRIMEHNQVS